MLGLVLVSSNGNASPLPWEGVLFLLLLLATLIMFSALFSATRRVLITLRSVKTITVLQCEKCDYKEEREFQVGDYVLKKVGECSKCKGPLYISMIYGVPEKSPPRPYGY